MGILILNEDMYDNTCKQRMGDTNSTQTHWKLMYIRML
jgi:hypothetical protein